MKLFFRSLCTYVYSSKKFLFLVVKFGPIILAFRRAPIDAGGTTGGGGQSTSWLLVRFPRKFKRSRRGIVFACSTTAGFFFSSAYSTMMLVLPSFSPPLFLLFFVTSSISVSVPSFLHTYAVGRGGGGRYLYWANQKVCSRRLNIQTNCAKMPKKGQILQKVA